MGRQIGLNTAIFGFEVSIVESNRQVREELKAWLETYLLGRVEKQRLSAAQAEDALGRCRVTGDLAEALDGAQLLIEAIVEERSAKEAFFTQADRSLAPDSIVATNSSYMVSSLFAGHIKNPARLANLHYFMPALVMKLVEVVKGEHTEGETVKFLMDFARATGKTPVLLNKEVDGFIVNSILRSQKDQAYRLLEEGVASVEDIDTAVELGLNYPMGPFRLTDFTGIDVNFLAYERRRIEKGEIPPGYDIVKAKYEAGELGKKTKKGFYSYD
jgi:3-hydroxybutyryl-CoA dehydrogenase